MNQTIPSSVPRDRVISLVSGFKNVIADFSYPQWLLFTILAVSVSSFLNNRPLVKAPYVGYRSWFEPTWLVQLRYFASANSIISEGYKKFKDGIFVVRRNDTDIVVLSNRYIDEVRLLPPEKMNGKKANIRNVHGEYTYTTEILSNNLHVRAIQNGLTPNLAVFLERANEELEIGLQEDMPDATEWLETDMLYVLRRLVARMSSMVFLGKPACRNEEWLQICVDYSINVFTTSLTLRMFPPWMHPFVARILPSRRHIRQNIKASERIMAPLITAYDQRSKDGEKNELPTMLDWMLENDPGTERNISELAVRQLILTLASIHSTASTVTQALFDLCAHPELFEPLREEAKAVLEQSGGTFKKEFLPRLELLDSFLVESARLNPLILLNPQRIVMEALTLRDGTFLPKGTHVAFAAAHLLSDESIMSNPETFDAYRSYKSKDSNSPHVLGQNDKSHLAFGNGKQACPGRLFAVAEIKTVMARMLLEYDFNYPEGKGRPSNWHVNEMVVVNPTAKLMMRKRREA